MSPRSDEFSRFVVVDERRWPALIFLSKFMIWNFLYQSTMRRLCVVVVRGCPWLTRSSARREISLFSVVVERLRGASAGEFALFIDCRAYILSRIYLFACVGICSFIYSVYFFIFVYLFRCIFQLFFSRLQRWTVVPWVVNETFIYRWSPYYLAT